MVPQRHIPNQYGFIASYILYGIGLLAIVGAAYGQLNSAARQASAVQDTVDEIAAQLDILTGKIMLCAAVYPDGDHGQFSARRPYPAPATTGNRANVSEVLCPGAPVGLQAMNVMPDRVPLPVAPPDFDEWVFEHTEMGGIRLRLSPRQPNGVPEVRVRLLRQYQGSAVVDGDDLVFTVLG